MQFQVFTDNERFVLARFGDGPIMRSITNKKDEFNLGVGVQIACRRAYVAWQGYELPEVMYAPKDQVRDMFRGMAYIPEWMLEEFLIEERWEDQASRLEEWVEYEWE